MPRGAQSPSPEGASKEDAEILDVGVTQYDDSNTDSELTCGVESEAGYTEDSSSELDDEPTRNEFAELERTNQQAILFNIKRVAVAPPRSARRDWLRQTRLSIGGQLF